MPLSSFQSEVLRYLADQRSPDSFIGGGLPINRGGSRYSEDIDIFHDREERVLAAADLDVKVLSNAGFECEWLRRQPSICSALVSRLGEATRLEWVADSDFRFFPAVRDQQFGFVLHIADLGVNKIMASAGRREPRDLVDLLSIHERHLTIGALACAATSVAPGFTPEGLVEEIARNSRYPESSYQQLRLSEPFDAAVFARKLRRALDDARVFIASMPTSALGLLFLRDGRAVQPDIGRLGDYVTHAPERRGHWPGSSEITTAMLEKLQRQSSE